MVEGLTIKGFPVLIAHLDPKVVKPITRRLLMKSAILIQRGARKKAPKFQGILTKSIVYNVRTTSAEIGSNLVYAAPTELGRLPGSAPPPPGSLLPWMARKGIPATMEYPLARSIGRWGTRPQPFLGPAFGESESTINGPYLEQAAQELEAATSV